MFVLWFLLLSSIFYLLPFLPFRSAYAAVNYRRPGFSSRCSPCLELSAAARHVCTVSFHLPKPSEDSPLQPLLSSCQARKVIPSLRPFLLLLLSLLLFPPPNLSRRRLDVCHTSTHGVALVRIWDAGLKRAACGSLKIQDGKKSAKIRYLNTIAKLCRVYLRN